jgi:putative ABC transport system permease protein
MLSPRWRKVLADVFGNKTRTALVVLSIAVGVFAIGMIGGARVKLLRGMQDSYAASHPASATLYTEGFDDDIVQTVRHMHGVAAAEGRRSVGVRVKVGPDEWKALQLIAIPHYDDIRINTFIPVQGAWPPKVRDVLLEGASVAFLDARTGEDLIVKTLDGKEHALRVGGTVHDTGRFPPFFSQTGYGYISFDTLERLGEPRDYNELTIVAAENALDKAHLNAVAAQVRDKVEKSGRTVLSVQVPNKPGDHPVNDGIQALILLLGVLGFFILLMSGFLVINTIGALLQQQTRQIGVMKSIGARSSAIIGMYLVTVLSFGVLALLIAIPLGRLGGQVLASYFADLFNFDIGDIPTPPAVFVIQVVAGLLLPLLAALWPVISGARITVREAIGGYGLGKGRFGRSRIDRALERIRFLSRPLLLSLRNTFRRKGRLALTLITLTLAGSIFIAVLSVRASVQLTLLDVFKYWDNDAMITLKQPYRIERLEDVALHTPGVARVEGWLTSGALRVRPDDSESENIAVNGPPADTSIFHPNVVAGRWLLPADENAVVVNTALLKNETDIKVGDELTLKIDGHKRTWRVVGIVRQLLDNPQFYINRPALARVTGQAGLADMLAVVTEQRDGAFQAQAVKELEHQFERAGLEISRSETSSGIRAGAQAQFDIIIVFLLVMAALLAFVGGLGLMGTMSMNVIERTREIGVIRAIGASNGAVLRIVMVEGVLVGTLSWVIGALLALPISKLLSDAVGNLFIQTPFSYVFSIPGMLLWLGLVVAIAALASFLPAWSAARLTVRDVLAYE